jgi:predicted cobalt transporter CbtA
MWQRLDVARPATVLVAALVCGLAAGLLAAVYASVIGEPLVDQAIAIEEATAAAQADGHDDVGHPAGEEHGDDSIEVSRPTQKGVGLFAAYGLFGAACGLLLAAAALSLRGPWLDPFRRVVIAGAILGTAITAVPWFKYPPNPPAVGDPTTASERQRLFFVLIALGCVVLAGAAHLSARLRKADWPDTRRIVAVGAAAVVALGLLAALMPPITDPIPSAVPAKLIWQFRVASLGGNAILWSVLTIGFGLLCAESVRARARAEQRAGEPSGQNSMPFIAEIPFS